LQPNTEWLALPLVSEAKSNHSTLCFPSPQGTPGNSPMKQHLQELCKFHLDKSCTPIHC
jgi:hypothetical protein